MNIFSTDSRVWRIVVRPLLRSTARLSPGLLLLCLAAPVQAVTFKIATLSPEGSGWMKILRSHAKVIEKKTNGNVKFKFYPGGVMGDDKAVMRKIRVGQLHGAVITAGGMVQTYPDIALYNLPMMFRDIAEVDAVRKEIDPKLMAGLERQKFIGFGLAEVGFAYPMTQQRAASVGEMRAQKVWTPDNDSGALAAFEAFDISPIPLPMADVLAGLQTGLINSVATPPIGAIALQWYTQVQYGLELPLLYVYGLLTMSERSFKKLDPAEQTIVRQELSAAVAEVDASARRDHESATSALSRQGIVWVKPDAGQLDEWLNLAAQARQRLIATGYVSEQLYNEVEQVLAKQRGG